MKTIKLTLSESGIAEAIRQLQEYKQSIIDKTKALVQEMVAQGSDICRAEIVHLDIPDTGYLLSRVNAETAAVVCDCEYAVFVEFGTGLKGQGEPYPGPAMAQAAYTYLGGTTYITTPDGRYGWFYPADDGTWKFTEGMPSRPFMYNTANEMRRIFPDTVEKVFG